MLLPLQFNPELPTWDFYHHAATWYEKMQQIVHYHWLDMDLRLGFLPFSHFRKKKITFKSQRIPCVCVGGGGSSFLVLAKQFGFLPLALPACMDPTFCLTLWLWGHLQCWWVHLLPRLSSPFLLPVFMSTPSASAALSFAISVVQSEPIRYLLWMFVTVTQLHPESLSESSYSKRARGTKGLSCSAD